MAVVGIVSSELTLFLGRQLWDGDEISLVLS